MEDQKNLILDNYDSKYQLYDSLRESTQLLIQRLLKLQNLSTHQINSRLKQKKSLEEKIIRENYKYSSLDEITDIVGLRIITYFEDEIDVIANLIEKEFEIDRINSTDKRIHEINKFGYRSLHYIVEYNHSRLKLSEYSKFENLKIEIQIRSILQHSWAEIEHDIGYKGENEIPNSAKRTFFRVAALLEQADIEFNKLKKEISNYEEIVNDKIKKTPSYVEINKASIASFIANNKTLKEAEKKIIESRDKLKLTPQEKRDFVTNERIERILSHGIKTIKDLENIYEENIDKIIQYQIKRLKNRYGTIGFVEGVSIFWLIDELETNANNAYN